MILTWLMTSSEVGAVSPVAVCAEPEALSAANTVKDARKVTTIFTIVPSVTGKYSRSLDSAPSKVTAN
jgi:hypothetical protein